MAEINIKDNTLNEFFDAIMMLNGKEELQRFLEREACFLLNCKTY